MITDIKLVHLFNGPLGTRLTWVSVATFGPTRGQDNRCTPEEARALGFTLEANCAALDNAVYLGGCL
jgi:hypothetical protein